MLSNLRAWNEKKIIKERKYQSREFPFLCGFNFSVRVSTAMSPLIPSSSSSLFHMHLLSEAGMENSGEALKSGPQEDSS